MHNPPSGDAFERAIQSAVRATSSEAKAELADLRALLRTWEQRLDAVCSYEPIGEDGEPLETPRQIVRREVRRLGAGARRRARHLDRFNVVLFGRTGAGKSSFVEALSRGDGRRISPRGLLDHTRDVEERQWRGFSLVDTPGIQGWAESKERARIEKLAHEAVGRADVVILAFDTNNQKIGEFRQVAEWVTKAGKAAVALLNVKDESWRFDEMLSSGDPRTLAVSQVRGHIEHVTQMLAEFGMPDVPVIALNTQWAVAARSRSLTHHPALEELLDAVKLVGHDRLEHISNIPAVTDLLQEAVQSDANTLRLGGVRTEIAAVLDRFAADLEPRRKALKLELRAVERQLADGLRRTGFDPAPAPARFGEAADVDTVRELTEVLRQLWPAKDERMRARDSKELRTKVERALDPQLARLRNEGIRRVQAAIGEAFTKRRSLGGDALASMALREDQLRSAVQAALTSAFADLGDDLRQAAEDAKLELDLAHEGIGFDHGTGKGARRVGSAGGWGSAALIGIGLATGGFGFAAAAVGMLGSVFARRRRKAAEWQLREHRAQAERRLGVWLDGVLRDARKQAVGFAQDRAIVVGAQTFLPLARDAVAMAGQRATLAEVAHEARARLKTLSRGRRSQEVIAAAKVTVQDRRHPGAADAAEKVWFGEDWLDEPEHGEVVGPVPLVLRPYGTDFELHGVDLEAVRSWLAGCVGRVPEQLAASVDRARSTLTEAPQVVLVGDYSAGKTTLLRRMGAELGLPEVDDLAVGAGPTTASVVRIGGPDYTVVDTPGLQSERTEDERTARAAIAGGAVIVVIHSATSGDLSTVTSVVRPQHLPERADRVVHVLGRIDALASRPHRNGPAFVRLLETKRTELRGRLVDAGLPCPAALPLPVAADPGGRHADVARWAPASFDLARGWDGVDALLAVLQRLVPDARPAAAVDRFVSDLADERDALDGKIADLEAGAAQLGPIVRLHERARRDHDRLEGQAKERLRAVVEDLITERAEELADAGLGTLHAVEADPESWFLTDDLDGRLDAWTAEVDERAAGIYSDLEQSIKARTGKPAFETAAKRMPTDGMLKDAFDEVKAHAPKAASAIGRAAMKQAPTLVKNLGPHAGRVAGALASPVIEGLTQELDKRAARKQAAAMQEAFNTLHDAGEQWVTTVLEGTGGDKGVLHDLIEERRERIDAPFADRTTMAQRLRTRIDETQEQRLLLETLMQEGRDLLV